MPINSTADLLFRIGANSDDAEDNIKRFRSIFSTNFTEMGDQFKDWAEETFGSLNSAAGIATAGVATMAAGLAAASAEIVHGTHEYEQYVEEVEHGARVTNLSTETMSGLHLAAQMTGTSFDTLTRGIASFETQVSKANEGGKQQLSLFQRLGISQAQLAAGEKDIIPLLDAVAKGFHNLGSGAERVAIARGLFSRSGVEDQKVLDLLAQGIEKVVEQAHRMGMTVTEEDVIALEKYQVAMAATKAAQEAIDIQIGRTTLPLLTDLKVGLIALVQAEDSAIGKGSFSNFFVWFANNIQFALTGTGDIAKRIHEAAAQIRAEMKALTDAMHHAEDPKPADGGGVKAATEQWRGLSNMLETVKGDMAATEGEEAKLTEKIARMTQELKNSQEELEEKHKSGKLAPGVYGRELAAMKQILDLLPQLRDALQGEADKKNTDKVVEWSGDINRRLLEQTEQTRTIREAGWAAEMAGLREHLAEDKNLTLDEKKNLGEMIDTLRATGLEKLRAGWDKEDKATGEHLQKELAGEAKTLAAKHQFLDLEMNAREAALNKEDQEYAAHLALLAQIRAQDHAKIDADAKAAADSEMARLGEELKRIESAHQTSEQRIEAGYQADVVKFTAAEEKKTLAAFAGDARQAQIHAMFDAIRKGLLNKEQADLQALHNSQGWQGIFGAAFEQDIRRNEALLKEWQTSAQQAHMLVRVSLESLKEEFQESFDKMEQAMGQSIAQAIVYGKSIGDAMRQAAVQELEQLSARAYYKAIDAAATGLMCLVAGDFGGAAQAFEAAALWGAIGTGEGMAARAMNKPGAAGAGAGAGSGSPGVGQYGSNTAARQADMQGIAAPGGGGGPHITVNVQGHVVGWTNIGELTSALSDAVLNQDQTLTATNTKTGMQVTQ